MSTNQLIRALSSSTPVKPINRDEHSEVGASGRQRWAVCAGSRKFIRRLPKHPQSAAAKWGSDAHDHAEKYLKHLLQVGPKPPRIEDKEMRKCVQDYVERCCKILEDYQAQYPGIEFRIWIEERFTLPGMPDAYGTVDFAAYFPALKLLIVVDLKTGGGILVHSYENPQLLYYATALMFQEFVEVKEAILAISAPRAPEDYQWKPWTVTGTRLFEELAKLRAEILATEVDDAPLVSGAHCNKSFCPAMAICPARREEAQKMATLEFAPAAVELFSREELGQLFLSIDRIKATCHAISNFAHAEAYAGRPLPGTKLVDKNLGNRKWINEEVAEAALHKAMLASGKPGDLYERTLIGPKGAEKILGAKSSLLDYQAKGTLVKRDSSGATLVPESDKRPAAVLTGDFASVPQIGEDSE